VGRWNHRAAMASVQECPGNSELKDDRQRIDQLSGKQDRMSAARESSYRKIRPRIESLSDLVFGLALSIGSLALIGSIPKDTSFLESGVLYFAFSFLIVIMIWAGYTRTLAYLPIETEATFFLNVALLFVVALEPFLFYVLLSVQPASPGGLSFLDSASIAYALDVGAMYLILSRFALMVSIEENRKGDPSNLLIRRFKLLAVWLAVVAALFLVSALPIFRVQVGGSSLRFDLWYASLAIFIATRFVGHEPRVRKEHA
ncbi:MAG: TMEM175 family protein, partial [Nitrososphaerales archaeon]